MQVSFNFREHLGLFMLPLVLFTLSSGELRANTLFGPPTIIPVSGTSQESIVLHDLNNDGNLDIIVGTACVDQKCANGLVSVLLGNGDGTFQSPVQYQTDYGPGPVAVADVNNDGKPDVIVVNLCPFVGNGGCLMAGVIQVFLGNGDGTLQSPIASQTAGFLGPPVSIAVADFDGDGIPDLAATFIAGGFVSLADSGLIFKGKGDGSFNFAFALSISGHDYEPLDVAAGDFDGDGKIDLALIASNWGNVVIHKGNGDETFTPWSSFHIGHGRELTVADINGDGRLDIAATTAAVVRVSYGNGDGTFQPPLGLNTVTDPDPRGVITGDFNGDGRMDLAVALGSNNVIGVYLQKATGTFPRTFITAPGGPIGLAAGDLNHDGRLDIVTIDATDNTVGVFLNQNATASIARD